MSKAIPPKISATIIKFPKNKDTTEDVTTTTPKRLSLGAWGLLSIMQETCPGFAFPYSTFVSEHNDLKTVKKYAQELIDADYAETEKGKLKTVTETFHKRIT